MKYVIKKTETGEYIKNCHNALRFTQNLNEARVYTNKQCAVQSADYWFRGWNTKWEKYEILPVKISVTDLVE